MAEALCQLLIENLGSLIASEVGLIRGVNKEINKLSNTFTTIKNVLEDAEERQFKEKSIQDWLRRLNVLAFEIEDILDECAVEVFKQKRKGGRFKLKYNIFKHIYFKRKMAKKIKEAVEQLDAHEADGRRFNFQESVAQQPNQLVDLNHETGSLLDEPDHIYGRDEEKETIVDILVNKVKDCEKLSVLPIIGVGGLGKTTLAQFVYNDERVTAHFDTKLWVCVSDDFDLKVLLKAIIESATRRKPDVENLDSLQHCVRQELNQKRYLLILDDVWNENQEHWDKLKSVLACGSVGASVVVTTRVKKVANIMGTLPAHQLTMLAEEKCWLLFKRRAFGQEDGQHPNLEIIGRRIVKKCAGVPLVAKALGGLLRCKREEEEWNRVEESNLWDLPEKEISILPALRLSYRHLPFKLKRCFAYCALFSKDYKFDKEELIFHWMAHGCISSNEKDEVEDVGDQIWKELVVRSFFQEIQTEGRNTTFKMHDLIHDLAQSILENKISGTQTNLSSASDSGSKTRQVELSGFPYFSPNIALESFLTTIKTYTRLRTLKLIRADVKELPSAIGKLKHLRHLDLSHSSIHTLPGTFCSLYNLKILILKGCRRLKSLPGNLRHLTNLRHIFLGGCFAISHIPYRIGKLTSLKTLSVFIVGGKIGKQLDELEHLNLGGTLEIRHLDKVLQNHKNANLVEKPNLCDLDFDWDIDSESAKLTKMMDDEKVLEALQPHPNLESLKIKGFRGRELALWMKNLKNLTRIQINKCRNCKTLPPLGDLPLLNWLKLANLDALEYVVEKDDIGCQNSSGVKFPSLEYLILYDMRNLKGFIKEERVGEMFPNLKSLCIEGCPLMIQTSTSVSCTLKKLERVWCSPSNLPFLSAKPENLPSLEVVKLSNFEIGSCLPVGWLGHLTSLRVLTIQDCTELEDLDFPEEFKHLHFLKRLELICINDMVSLPQGLQQIPSLQSLRLDQLPQLTSLPDWLPNLASLTTLKIEYCPKIESLPSSIQGMLNLTSLRISGCPQLQRRCEEPNGEDWPNIAHILEFFIY